MAMMIIKGKPNLFFSFYYFRRCNFGEQFTGMGAHISIDVFVCVCAFFFYTPLPHYSITPHITHES